MKVDKAKGFLIGALFASLACVLQVVGLIRYLGRLPEDWVGIALYCISIVALAAAAIGFYIQWERR